MRIVQSVRLFMCICCIYMLSLTVIMVSSAVLVNSSQQAEVLLHYCQDCHQFNSEACSHKTRLQGRKEYAFLHYSYQIFHLFFLSRTITCLILKTMNISSYAATQPTVSSRKTGENLSKKVRSNLICEGIRKTNLCRKTMFHIDGKDLCSDNPFLYFLCLQYCCMR